MRHIYNKYNYKYICSYMSTVVKSFELTLCILKPHIIAAPPVVREIRNIIQENGFEIIKVQHRNISLEEASQFYNEHSKKFFYNRLITFMCSGPCGFYILSKRNAIEEWRKILGPTKVFQSQFSHPNSIRGIHGLTDTRNAAHGSDSFLSAIKEIKVFFPEFDAEACMKLMNS